LVATSVSDGLRSLGHRVWFASAVSDRKAPWSIQLGRDISYIASNPSAPLSRSTNAIKEDINEGYEIYDFLACWDLIKTIGTIPDLVHFHNLHGNFFDLRFMQWISRRVPSVLTLHDAWLTSGNCAHSFECNRWSLGCGNCPDISIYPGLKKDRTRENYIRKAEILAKARYTVVSPAKWLLEKAQRSILTPGAIGFKLIPNGVDLAMFRPREKGAIRNSLGISTDSIVILFAAHRFKVNHFKDFRSFLSVIDSIRHSNLKEHVHFLMLGDEMPTTRFGNVMISGFKYERSRIRVAELFSCADIYLHLSKAETFPTAVLEAMASGLPVVANRVGGLAEQVRCLRGTGDICKATGLIAESAESKDVLPGLEDLITQKNVREILSKNSRMVAEAEFSTQRMINQYAGLFAELTLQLST